jgi:hypothetical protein
VHPGPEGVSRGLGAPRARGPRNELSLPAVNVAGPKVSATYDSAQFAAIASVHATMNTRSARDNTGRPYRAAKD